MNEDAENDTRETHLDKKGSKSAFVAHFGSIVFEKKAIGFPWQLYCSVLFFFSFSFCVFPLFFFPLFSAINFSMILPKRRYMSL